MYLEELRRLKLPSGLTTRVETDRNLSLLRSAGYCDYLRPTPELENITGILASPQLDSWIQKGRLSIGLVKPRAFESKWLPISDEAAAWAIRQEVGSQRLLFHMPWKLTPPDVEVFYAPHKHKYFDTPQTHTTYGTTVWESIMNHATSGAITFMLIGGDEAIRWWRNRIGKTRPLQADPGSIRGKYGIEGMLPNNLVHGSDSPESATRELETFRSSLTEVYKALHSQP